MVQIGGTPLLEHQINLAKKFGISDIFILAGYKSDVIFDYFEDGAKFGVNITHILEPRPLGTAGSLKLLEHVLTDKFILFYGDVFIDVDLNRMIEFDKTCDCIATLAVHPNDHPYDSDLLEMNENKNVTQFHSKPHDPGKFYNNLVNAAFYILSPRIFSYIPFGHPSDFGNNIFPSLLRNNELLAGYKLTEYVKDLGTPERLTAVLEDFDSGKTRRRNVQNKQRAIFLDRDGVINQDVDNLSRIEDFNFLNAVPGAIKKLNKSEYLCLLVTNQPMIAKGFMTERALKNIHRKMETILGQSGAFIDDIFYCPHHPESGFQGELEHLKIKCECRKPEPGMLIQASNQYNIDLSKSWMIGDHERDLMAGKAAECKTVYINPDRLRHEHADYSFTNLLEAVNYILSLDELV